MKNYISINGRQIELTDEQVKRFESDLNLPKLTLADIPVGKTFRIGGHEFIVLEHMGDTTAVICSELLPERSEFSEFGENNNYDGSKPDLICRMLGDEISRIIGAENIIEHTVDLTSDDGLKDYGTVSRKCSLISADQYRRYVDLLDHYKPDSWWWLATPFSTKRHGNDEWILCVSPSGCIRGTNYCGNVIGVRPFCIFKSSIFESSEG